MSDIYAKLGKNLIGTKTFDNLMEAFAGESQARNKYTYFASKAKKDGYVQIAKIFEQTAANEREHAKIWYKILEGVHDTKDNLEIAADGEQYEWQEMSKISQADREYRGRPCILQGRRPRLGMRQLRPYRSRPERSRCMSCMRSPAGLF